MKMLLERAEADARAGDGAMTTGGRDDDLQTQMKALVHHLGNDTQVAISALRLIAMRLPEPVLADVDPLLQMAMGSLYRAGERRRKVHDACSSVRTSKHASAPPADPAG